MANRRDKKQPAKKLGDLFMDFGDVTAEIISHPECPSLVKSVLSEMMSNIDGEASRFADQQSRRQDVEARQMLPDNLTILMLAGRSKKGGKNGQRRDS